MHITGIQKVIIIMDVHNKRRLRDERNWVNALRSIIFQIRFKVLYALVEFALLVSPTQVVSPDCLISLASAQSSINAFFIAPNTPIL